VAPAGGSSSVLSRAFWASSLSRSAASTIATRWRPSTGSRGQLADEVADRTRLGGPPAPRLRTWRPGPCGGGDGAGPGARRRPTNRHGATRPAGPRGPAPPHGRGARQRDPTPAISSCRPMPGPTRRRVLRRAGADHPIDGSKGRRLPAVANRSSPGARRRGPGRARAGASARVAGRVGALPPSRRSRAEARARQAPSAGAALRVPPPRGRRLGRGSSRRRGDLDGGDIRRRAFACGAGCAGAPRRVRARPSATGAVAREHGGVVRRLRCRRLRPRARSRRRATLDGGDIRRGFRVRRRGAGSRAPRRVRAAALGDRAGGGRGTRAGGPSARCRRLEAAGQQQARRGRLPVVSCRASFWASWAREELLELRRAPSLHGSARSVAPAPDRGSGGALRGTHGPFARAWPPGVPLAHSGPAGSDEATSATPAEALAIDGGGIGAAPAALASLAGALRSAAAGAAPALRQEVLRDCRLVVVLLVVEGRSGPGRRRHPDLRVPHRAERGGARRRPGRQAERLVVAGLELLVSQLGLAGRDTLGLDELLLAATATATATAAAAAPAAALLAFGRRIVLGAFRERLLVRLGRATGCLCRRLGLIGEHGRGPPLGEFSPGEHHQAAQAGGVGTAAARDGFGGAAAPATAARRLGASAADHRQRRARASPGHGPRPRTPAGPLGLLVGNLGHREVLLVGGDATAGRPSSPSRPSPAQG